MYVISSDHPNGHNSEPYVMGNMGLEEVNNGDMTRGESISGEARGLPGVVSRVLLATG